MSNPDWPRWIFASIGDHLTAVGNSAGFPSVIEGVHDKEDAFLAAPLRAEIRINGPHINEPSKGYFHVVAIVDVLITANMDAKSSRYDLHRLAGIYQSAIAGEIPLWNFGDQVGDFDEADPASQIHLGCLRPRPTKRPAIKVLHFGQVNRTESVRQSAVDAELETYICE